MTSFRVNGQQVVHPQHGQTDGHRGSAASQLDWFEHPALKLDLTPVPKGDLSTMSENARRAVVGNALANMGKVQRLDGCAGAVGALLGAACTEDKETQATEKRVLAMRMNVLRVASEDAATASASVQLLGDFLASYARGGAASTVPTDPSGYRETPWGLVRRVPPDLAATLRNHAQERQPRAHGSKAATELFLARSDEAVRPHLRAALSKRRPVRSHAMSANAGAAVVRSRSDGTLGTAAGHRNSTATTAASAATAPELGTVNESDALDGLGFFDEVRRHAEACTSAQIQDGFTDPGSALEPSGQGDLFDGIPFDFSPTSTQVPFAEPSSPQVFGGESSRREGPWRVQKRYGSAHEPSSPLISRRF